jgi:hypothetical protein
MDGTINPEDLPNKPTCDLHGIAALNICALAALRFECAPPFVDRCGSLLLLLLLLLLLQGQHQQVINGLRRTLERTHARVEDLRNFRSLVFSGVFSHRFRCVFCVGAGDEKGGVFGGGGGRTSSVVIKAIGEWVEALFL